jgi:pilus assembly protein CpaB
MRIFAGKGAVFAAIALGLLTSYLTWRYIDQAHTGQAAVETTPVVLAAMAIPVRTVITPDLLRVQQMPVDAAHPQSVHSADQIIGKVARVALTADEQVLTSKLYLQRGESGLAFMVPDGMRAISVAFNEVMGSGGMVAPGDHVDILGVFEAKPSDVAASESKSPGTKTQAKPTPAAIPSPADAQGGQTEEKISIATLVLQDVEVLAVAQQLEGETPPDKGPSMPLLSSGPTSPAAAQSVRAEPSPQPAAKTATVAVTPEDALKIVLAEEKGKIRLALRRAKDTNRPIIAQVPMSVLLTPAQ